jgi:hypothetical protein
VPFGFAGFEQSPVAGSQVPTSWHWSRAVQMIRLLPTHLPFWHVSVWVQASKSLQGVPFGVLTNWQLPLMHALTRHGASGPVGSGQTTPHSPQFNTSVRTFVHLPAKLMLVGSAQTFGEPVGQTHCPDMQSTLPVGQQCLPQTRIPATLGQQNLSAALS